MSDKFTRLLLFVLVVGVWLLALSPRQTSAGSTAQAGTGPVLMAVEGENVFVISGGKLSKWVSESTLRKRGEESLNVRPYPLR